MNVFPEATSSSSGMPRGRSLYGDLPDQLTRPESFASQVRDILALRSSFGLDVATQVDIPDVAHPGMLVLVHRLDEGDATLEEPTIQVTVLNFTGEAIDGTVRSPAFIARRTVSDATTGESIGHVDDLQSFSVTLPPYGGLFLLLDAPVPVPDPVDEEFTAAEPVA
jgi:hypothetical protein